MKSRKWRWADIGELYSVSDHGSVFSYRTGIFLKPDLVSGYLQVTLYLSDGKIREKVHTLVARYFIGPRPAGKEVNHKDAIKTNNWVDNLEYLTKKQNAQHALGLGHYTTGEQHWKAKASKAIVLDIRRRYRKGNGAALGREHGLDSATVNHIIHRYTWKHI